jgi:Asp-tRNA(Asn)/Glu-tRNA(Gln) amidotransferase A subunit family amidase
MRHVHAFEDDALGELDAVALAEAIKSGRLTRAEAVEAAIARTEAVNSALNGLACQAFDEARAKVLERGSDGEFFAGVPTFVKDCVDVAGLPTMSGTDAWVPLLAGADSDCARLYLATGLISLGKTQLPELGLGASAEHPRLGSVRNPWNTDYTAGGSSSGSAAFDRGRLNNLTLGLDRYARRNMHRLPVAIMRLRAVRRRTAQFFGAYDAVLTPTVADETPRLGYLDPTADSQQIIDRGGNWAAFTPLQNVTGEPAISLPLAESASGMPVGMMFSADVGREARLLELAFELEEARPWTRIQSRAQS